MPPAALRRSRLRLALQLLHPGPSALRRCRLQPHRGRSGLPALPADPRSPRLGLVEPDLRPPAGAAPHGGEPPGRPREGHGRRRREIEALVAELAPRADVPSIRAKAPPHSHGGPDSALPAPAEPRLPGDRTPAARPRRSRNRAPQRRSAPRVPPRTPLADAAPDRPGLGAERYRVQFTIGEETHEKLRRLAGASPPRDPRRRSGRDLRPRARRCCSRRSRRRSSAAAAKPRPPRAIRPGTDTDVA